MVLHQEGRWNHFALETVRGGNTVTHKALLWRAVYSLVVCVTMTAPLHSDARGRAVLWLLCSQVGLNIEKLPRTAKDSTLL